MPKRLHITIYMIISLITRFSGIISRGGRIIIVVLFCMSIFLIITNILTITLTLVTKTKKIIIHYRWGRLCAWILLTLANIIFALRDNGDMSGSCDFRHYIIEGECKKITSPELTITLVISLAVLLLAYPIIIYIQNRNNN